MDEVQVEVQYSSLHDDPMNLTGAVRAASGTSSVDAMSSGESDIAEDYMTHMRYEGGEKATSWEPKALFYPGSKSAYPASPIRPEAPSASSVSSLSCNDPNADLPWGAPPTWKRTSSKGRRFLLFWDVLIFFGGATNPATSTLQKTHNLAWPSQLLFQTPFNAPPGA